jgi:hypothetical protein
MIDVRSHSTYVPMRIVAVMDEPIAYLGDLLHIDGPIAQAAFCDLDERTRKTFPPVASLGGLPWVDDLTLPLATWWVDYNEAIHGSINERLTKRAERGAGRPGPRLWGWCASAADERAWGIRGKLDVRKRPELGKIARYTDAPTANIKSGHMKAYDLQIPTVFTHHITWHALGDPDRVRHLLAMHIHAIGKKRNIGAGAVREWRVETDGVDAERWRERRFPAGIVDGPTRYASIRPPYWHHSRMLIAVEPIWD